MYLLDETYERARYFFSDTHLNVYGKLGFVLVLSSFQSANLFLGNKQMIESSSHQILSKCQMRMRYWSGLT